MNELCFPFWLNGAELGSMECSGNQHSVDLEEAHQAIFKHADSDQLVMISAFSSEAGLENLHLLPVVPRQTSQMNPGSCRAWLISHVCTDTGL